ncbi:MAG: hypothetical protein IKG66_04005 [Lachnospiraceae bacterium]|nr:hypothetical protein [Lachnospiraceae bacterium]
MSRGMIIAIVVLVILVAALVALYFVGRRMERQQAEQQAQVEATKQPVTMLVIDKKRLKLKDSGLPEQVISQTPWYAKRSKVPIVRAKVGPQYINFICDEKYFDLIPVKKQVKAMVSGIYIAEVRGLRGSLQPAEPVKKSWFRRQVDKLQEKVGAKPVK